MATSNRSERLRFRYGICLNDGCSKCKSKEVQEISARKEFVCAECGKPLRECPPPKSWWEKNGKKAIIAVAVVILGGVGTGIALSGGDEPSKTDEVVKVDSLAAQDSVKSDTAVANKEPEKAAEAADAEKDKSQANNNAGEKVKKQTATSTVSKPKHAPGERYQGTLNLGYGTYSGEIVDGQPDGAGVLRYKTSHKVVSTKDVMAESGERIEGVFDNGKPSMVTLYKNDGNTIKVHR